LWSFLPFLGANHNMAYAKTQKVQRKYYYAIIDEVDSVLIDEAKTPLIIAGKTMPSENLANVCAKVTKNFQQDVEFQFDHELKTVNITDEGINKIERAFGIENLFDLEHRSLYHYMLQALRARVLFTRDVDYIVDQGEVKLVDMNTGRIMEGRSLSDGLHQAIEAKEGLKVTEENKAQASVSIQNYFRMYPVLSGMTGTAKTEITEFQHVYCMDVVQIPTNKPIIRKDLPDLVFKTKEQKYRRMVEEVRQRHEKGQPILIGTTSILQSEVVAEYLDEAGLSYHLLNAKSVEHEAHLISLAGQKSQITIATNMAGRGTDIMLGEGVAELGGLHVLGTEKHESRRIDNQLKGRSGRQGDPGSTQFIISLEDELFIRFAKDDVEAKLPSLTTDSTGLILNKEIHKFIDKVQKISEGSHFSVREFSLKLDDIINDQREVIYKLRDQIFYSTNTIEILKKHVEPVVLDLVDKHCSEGSIPDDWDLKGLNQKLEDFMLVEVTFDRDYEDPEEVREAVKPFIERHLEEVSFHENVEEIQNTLRQVSLALVDHHWTEHLDEMNRMKEGVGIRHYQQEDPIRTFQKEGFELFEIMYHRLELDFNRRMTRAIQQFEARKIKIDLT
ncbi:accessory Sec system translocase SecA2, partial [Bacillaceae bacterium S4-13-58]